MDNIKHEAQLTLSPNAIAHLSAILSQDETHKFLRLSVDSGGCSGFKYKFELDHVLHEDDLKISEDSAILVVDPLSFEFVKGAEVDYVEELIGSAFVIRNPNASSSCGCGSSFSL